MTIYERNKVEIEKGIIEHTCLDIIVSCPVTKSYLGRPWLSVLIDENTGKVLAHCITINPPSYVNIMMLIGECIRRNLALPQTIMLRDEKEYHSEQLDELAILGSFSFRYTRSNTTSISESFYKKINKMILNYLGANRLMRNEDLDAKIYISKLDKAISFVLYDVIEQQRDPFYKKRSRMIFGALSPEGRLLPIVSYVDEIILLTIPQIELKISKYGIKVYHIYYWTKEFQGLSGKMIQVKCNPLKLEFIYCYLNGAWKRVPRYLISR
jgi:putative transposase